MTESTDSIDSVVPSGRAFANVADAPRSDDPGLIGRLAEALDDVGFLAGPITELLGSAAVEDRKSVV